MRTRSERRVILSAAGAKDLLSVVPKQSLGSPIVLKQVLRSRACRALAQDDSAARFGKEKSENLWG